MSESSDRDPLGASGCAGFSAAMLLSSGVATVIIAVGSGLPFVVPFVFGIVLFLAAVVGLPLYLVARRMGCANAATAAAGGFFTGMLIPGLGLLASLVAAGQIPDWPGVLWTDLLYGGAGVAGGLIFWLVLTWTERGPPRTLARLGLGYPKVAADSLHDSRGSPRQSHDEDCRAERAEQAGGAGQASQVQGEASEGAFKVNSLGNLENADAGSGRLQWDAPRSIWNMSFIAGAIVLGPMFFSWSGLAVFLLLSGFTLCVGHSVGFHRRLIHRSFECPKWLERVMIYVCVLVGMGGPLWTVGLHDIRDWAQRQADCHWFLRHGKPALVDGFYYLNFKLLFDRPPLFDAGPGISDGSFYRFLQRTWMLHQAPVALILFWFGGWSWVVWSVIVRVAVCFTMHWYIAHVAHRRGHQDWFVEDAAVQGYNIAWLAIPTMDESWHCNHHAFPASARHGLYPGQADPGFRFVQLLELLGLAWNIQLPCNLPPRSAITPLTTRALSIAAAGQGDLSRH